MVREQHVFHLHVFWQEESTCHVDFCCLILHPLAGRIGGGEWRREQVRSHVFERSRPREMLLNLLKKVKIRPGSPSDIVTHSTNDLLLDNVVIVMTFEDVLLRGVVFVGSTLFSIRRFAQRYPKLVQVGKERIFLAGREKRVMGPPIVRGGSDLS